MGNPADGKAALRTQVTERLAGLSSSQVESESRLLRGCLGPWAMASGFQVVLATLPLAGEPDLVPFLREWAASGRRVALARTGPGRALGFRYPPSLDGPWEPRPYGMREPGASAPPWEPGLPTLCLVPGLAFAPAPGGGALRLGRGAGYYDRWLAVHGESVFALGIALEVQTLETLPVEDHDRRLDGWLTPSGFRGFTPTGTRG